MQRRTLSLIALLVFGAWSWAPAQNRENPMARFEDDSERYQVLWREGQYRESLTTLEASIERSNEVPLLWLYDRAELYYVVGEVDRAINEIEWLHYRRPYPSSALQLARYYQARGDRSTYQRILDQASNRYRRFRGGVDETDNALAMIRIKELQGENPRVLFQDILSVEEREEENQVKRYLAAGDLAWRKYDWALSASYYEKALELEPDNLEAMSGLAECYWKSGDPRLGETMEKVLAVNSRHPRILGIQAELHLENDRFEEASELIEKVLAFNPRYMRFLGLKSAMYFLQGLYSESERIQEEALVYNPYASEVFRITGRIASRKYRFKEAAQFQARALELDPKDAKARGLLAFDLLRLGDDKLGYEELTKSFEKDRFNVQVFNMLEVMDKVQDFSVMEKSGFRIQMPPREMEVWGDDVHDMLVEAMALFEDKYKFKVERPVHVQIFDNHDDFMVRSLGLPGHVGFLGICFGNLITMDTPSARGKGEMNWMATLWHEYVHVVTLQKTNNKIPRWLSEGISVYEETVRDPSWGQRLMPPYQTILNDEGLPGLDDLEPFLTQPKSVFHTQFGYFASGEFVAFYVDNYGIDNLVKSLDLIRDGVRAEDALRSAAGVKDKELDKAFKNFLGDRVAKLRNMEGPGSMNLFGGGPPPIPAPDSPFFKAMRTAQEALQEDDKAKAEEALLEAIELFPEYISGDSPRFTLAELYRQMEQPEKQRKVLEDALAMDSSNLTASLQLSELYREAELWDKLYTTAGIGLLIDPFDVNLRTALVDAAVKLDRKEEALDQLARLIKLDNARAVDHRLKRLDILMDRENWNEARTEVLRLLDQVPYSWEAQKRLLTITNERGSE